MPNVTIESWPDGATVLLVEAAGAVGKSAAAQALAESLRCPLIRSERAQVGSHSLSGLIHDALGYSSSFIAELAEGKRAVVVDSLDEAHFRAGTDNFLAFLENVQKVSGATPTPDPGRRPSVVLFSRTDTAELVKLAFLDAAVPLATGRIDFFDLGSAQTFINAYMEQRRIETGRSEYNIPMASPRPFERLRHSRMRSVASVLLRRDCTSLRDDWNAVRDFLGYVPVLVALAESLAVSNPAAERHELEASDRSDLLVEIIDFILLREQQKLSVQLKPKLYALLPPEEDERRVSASLYSPLEQSIRVAALVAGAEVRQTLPAGLSTSVRAAYDEAVGTFLSDHPFVKNRAFASVVFQDYVLASVCRELEARAAFSSPPEHLVTTTGPFFARFLATATASGTPSIREGIVEHVLHSWSEESALAQAPDSEARLQLLAEQGTLECLRSRGPGSEEIVELEFEILELTGVLHLKRFLRYTTIATDHAVILGTRGAPLTLGPDVIVVAAELVIEAEALRIDTDGGTRFGAGLSARVMTANQLQRVESGPQALKVFCPDPPPRLRPYRARLRVDRGFIPFQRFLDLRTILTAFRPSVRGGQAVLAAKLEGKIVGSNEHRMRLLSALIDCGSVSHQGRWYFLDLNALSQLGFGVNDLRVGEPGKALLDFLASAGCVETFDHVVSE